MVRRRRRSGTPSDVTTSGVRPASGATRTARDVGTVGLATVLVGLFGWVALLVVAQLEGPAGYAQFAVMWGIFYGVGGGLAGLQNEVMRTMRSQSTPSSAGPRRRLVDVSMATGTVVAVVTAAVTLLFGVLGDSWLAAAPLAVGLVGFTGLVVVLGVLAAQGRWGVFGALLIADSVVRLLTVALVVVLGGGQAALMAAIAAGSWVWLPYVVAGAASEPWSAARVTRLEPKGFLRRSVAGMAASGCAALLVAGFPFLVALVEAGPLRAGQAGQLAGLVLLRSPFLLVFSAYRPMILGRLLRRPDRVRPGVWGAWGAYAVAGTAIAAAAAVGGPPALRLALGPDFEVSGPAACAFAVSSVLLVMLNHSTLALTALDRHAHGTEGWVVALAATVVALPLLGESSAALPVAAVAGPGVGVVWHVVRLSGMRPSGQVRRMAS